MMVKIILKKNTEDKGKGKEKENNSNDDDKKENNNTENSNVGSAYASRMVDLFTDRMKGGIQEFYIDSDSDNENENLTEEEKAKREKILADVREFEEEFQRRAVSYLYGYMKEAYPNAGESSNSNDNREG